MKILNWLLGLFKRRPRYLWVADLHFSHRNVINYCDRPWPDRDAMNEGLVKLWNEQVGPNDIVYILGDFSLSPKAVKDFAPRLNGTKHLICGNHDAPFEFDVRPKAAKMREKYLNEFATVEMEGTFTLKNGVKVLMKHFPYSLEYDQRYRIHRPVDKGDWLLHGHLHAAYRKSNRQIDVGIDVDFKLLSEDDIIKIMEDKRDFIPTRLTGRVKNKNNMKGEDY